jgi:hypothetical protein
MPDVSIAHRERRMAMKIFFAESRRIPVLALYYRGAIQPISAMIAGNHAITTIIYDSIDHLRSLLRSELDP